MKKNDDYNSETQEGAGIFQQSAHRGLRYSSSVGYLDNHALPNLKAVLGATVTRVVIENSRATGVDRHEVRAGDGPCLDRTALAHAAALRVLEYRSERGRSQSALGR